MKKTEIRLYQTNAPSERARITLHKNLFSLLLEGSKTVQCAGNSAVTISPNQFLLLSSDNCLMTERLSVNGQYSAIVLHFDDAAFTDLCLKHPPISEARKQKHDDVHTSLYPGVGEPIIPFEKDAFLYNYIESLRLMLENQQGIPSGMEWLKFEELVLYLAEKHPQQLALFQPSRQIDTSDRQLQMTVEHNLHTNITVEELAFLCHTSLSTFKRRFARLYGTSPNKWLLQKRMQLAAALLQQYQEKPSEVYHKVGYENHSSFTQSFKQVYGMTPREFQQQKLDVYP